MNRLKKQGKRGKAIGFCYGMGREEYMNGFAALVFACPISEMIP
jgi:hypothetical protein